MNCRACIKCREYVTIHEDTHLSLQRQKIFDALHSKHPRITANLVEVEEYKNINSEVDKKIIKS